MDRVRLEELLASGLSLAEIGRRVGRHEATVGYWVERYGLSAVNRSRHLPRGGLALEHLQPLADSGMSIAEIASELGVSKTTVRHWLRRYGLKTLNGRGRRRSTASQVAKETGLRLATMTCARHGDTEHVLDGRGYFRCRRCRGEAVSRRRRKVKAILVQEAGGACCICGYAGNMRALHFHHVEPAEKRLEINSRGVALSLATLQAEARRCVLLCSNCHAEVEEGAVAIPDGALERTRSASRL